jgi:colicin import membrane protein
MDPTRDTSRPPRPAGMGKGALLAIAAHVLLVLALAWGVNWRSSTPDAVEAELWSAVPQAAAPPVATPPEPAPPPPPPPAVKPAPVQPAPPPPQEVPDAQIAIEKAQREARLREQEKQREADKREQQRLKEKQDKQKQDQAKALAQEKARQKEEADKARQRELAEQRQQKERQQKIEAARQAQLERVMGQAGATGTGPGTATRSSGPSSGYGGRIKARVKPNIVFNDNLSSNPVAEVEVRLAADGRIVSQKLLVSSGVKEWDDAVLRALERTEILPRDVDGTVPSSMVLSFRPRD